MARAIEIVVGGEYALFVEGIFLTNFPPDGSGDMIEDVPGFVKRLDRALTPLPVVYLGVVEVPLEGFWTWPVVEEYVRRNWEDLVRWAG